MNPKLSKMLLYSIGKYYDIVIIITTISYSSVTTMFLSLTNSHEKIICVLLPTAYEVWEKVMYLHLFVILFTGGEGVWYRGGV